MASGSGRPARRSKASGEPPSDRHARRRARPEAELLGDLKASASQAEAEASRPATLRQLCEFYALDMQARGKGEESVGRVAYTRKVIEDLVPELLDKPVSAINDADVFAFRNRRAREGTPRARARRRRQGAQARPDQAEHDQPRSPHALCRAQEGATRIPGTSKAESVRAIRGCVPASTRFPRSRSRSCA